MIALVLYASHPDQLATFYGSLFEMERSEIDGTSFSLFSPAMEFHIVKISDGIAGAITPSSPPAPREGTPLKFSIEVPSVDQLAATAQTLGGYRGVSRGTGIHGVSWTSSILRGTSFRCSRGTSKARGRTRGSVDRHSSIDR
jgi:predicted enzyme related to lactoylglutathione lyase